MNNVNIVLITLLCFFAVSATSASAKTKDGVTPGEESVCDELLGGTPGLFGLCVAYCEAKDCDNELSDCGTAGDRILANYNRKKAPGDPDMPCLAEPVPSATCPCFSETDIRAMSSPYDACFDNYKDMLTAIYYRSIQYRFTDDRYSIPRCYGPGIMRETTPEESTACLDLLTAALREPGACNVMY